MRSTFLASGLVLTAILAAPASAAPSVVTDFAPTQSIAARVMAGVGEPVQILPPGAEPHSYSLRPSEARALAEADLVIWVGPGMTPWLADPIDALAGGARVVTLDALPGLTLLPIRAGGPFEAHSHEHEGEDEDHAAADHDAGHEADHDADHDAGHDHAEPADADPDHDHDHADAAAPAADDHEAHDHDAHDHDAPHIDQHIWLDPDNAAVFAKAIAEDLASLDPANAAAYRANAAAFDAELDALTAQVTVELAPLRGRPYIVFHDAYQYFENRFALPAAGSVALHDAAAPGAARVAEIRDRLRAADAACVFSEPQFPPKLLATLTEGTGARAGALDPEGTALPPGPDLYPVLIRSLADGLAGCLGGLIVNAR